MKSIKIQAILILVVHCFYANMVMWELCCANCQHGKICISVEVNHALKIWIKCLTRRPSAGVHSGHSRTMFGWICTTKFDHSNAILPGQKILSVILFFTCHWWHLLMMYSLDFYLLFTILFYFWRAYKFLPVRMRIFTLFAVQRMDRHWSIVQFIRAVHIS